MGVGATAGYVEGVAEHMEISQPFCPSESS